MPLHSELLCAKEGGCACPDGTKLNARQVSKGIAEIGWQGGGASISGESVDDACVRVGHGPPKPPVPNTNVCHLLKASGVESIVPGGGYVAIENSCTYVRCFERFNDNGESKCALARGGSVILNKAASPSAAKKVVKKYLATAAFHRIAVGADLAAFAVKPGGGVIVMAVGRKYAVVDLGASADSPRPQPTWHNKNALTQMAKRVAKRL